MGALLGYSELEVRLFYSVGMFGGNNGNLSRNVVVMEGRMAVTSYSMQPRDLPVVPSNTVRISMLYPSKAISMAV